MDRETLKNYFGSRYAGYESFLNSIIFPLFGEENFISEYATEMLKNQPEWRTLAKASGIESVKIIGSIAVDIEDIEIFDITVNNRIVMERNRVGISQLIRHAMQPYSGAFIIFHYDDDARWDWRFSYCHKGGSRDKNLTSAKRFTFLLGPGQACRTAADNFMKIYEKHGNIELSDIENAFSVEALSKEFFAKYREQYDKFVAYMVSNKDLRNDFADHSADGNEAQEKPIRDYVKKLLGRIVFLHFLQKKGWLGVPEGDEWGKGDRQFLLHLFEYATDKQKDDFLDGILEPLFARGLDNDRQPNDIFDTKVKDFRAVRIPYLNGGLFERDEQDKKTCKFPKDYFEKLLGMLAEYNFTIDENDPDDAEVGVDPEMLGRIFENLLEDNKDKGAFYTPKEIVQYMCRESLIAYLQTDYNNETDHARIRQFVNTHDANEIGDIKDDILELLKNVKICDPAIGSGAFPMGLLRELFFCQCAIEPALADKPAEVKRHIIENNIYGVDIDRGAVDIARLRFWLALVVDEKKPTPLPNLDFKIMQGNSLLESYKSVNLRDIASFGSHTGELIFDDDTCNRAIINEHIRKYFETDNHNEREKLRNEINTAVKKLIIANDYRLKKDIEKLDVHANEYFCLFHTWFADVFSRPTKEGFDIVIGNPPYIQLQNNLGTLAQIYQDAGYETFARTGDIYCLFYERGFQLLRPGGHLCFITSNKWMRAGYGEKTRKFFAEKTNPELLIDFAGVKIFESATVDTNILLFSKAKNQHKTLCAVTSKKDKSSITNLSLFVQQHKTENSFRNEDSWVILSPIEQSIKRKIEAKGTPLKDWDISIYRGVLTGCNEAFIISTEKREEILANCKTDDERRRSEELIRAFSCSITRQNLALTVAIVG